jgi:hypothetical protein
MGILEAKDGILRFYDGTLGRYLDRPNIAICSQVGTEMVDILNKKAPILRLNTHRVFVGQVFKFSKIAISLGSPACNAGAILVDYWDRNSWVPVSNLVDGTDAMRKDGVVSWDVPTDWDTCVIGNRLFFVRISTVKSSTLAAPVVMLEPISGQYIDLPFYSIKITAPQGRNRPTEIIAGKRRLSDEPIFVQGRGNNEPVDVSISCVLQSSIEKKRLYNVLAVANPSIKDTWPLPGTTTKSLSDIPDGTGVLSKTKRFDSYGSNTLDIQVSWQDKEGKPVFWEWREVYFDYGHQSLPDEEEFDIMNLAGSCYGSINLNRIKAFGMELAA